MRRLENTFTAWLLVLAFVWTSIFSASGVVVPPSKSPSGNFFANTPETTWKKSLPALIPCWKNSSVLTTIASVSHYHDLVSQDREDGAVGFEMSFYSYDGLGSVRGLTDAIGTSLGNYHYDAYGLLIENTVSVANPYLFAGERFDNDLGLYYLRARYLDVETGRFWSLDEFQGFNSSPLSLHKYLYANGNGVSNTDPSGYVTLTQTALTSSLVGLLTGAGFGFNNGWIEGQLQGKQGAELLEEALIQMAIGGTIGAIAGPIMTLYPETIPLFVSAGIFSGGVASYSAFEQGHISLGIWRATMGIITAWTGRGLLQRPGLPPISPNAVPSGIPRGTPSSQPPANAPIATPSSNSPANVPITNPARSLPTPTRPVRPLSMEQASRCC